MSSVKLPNYRDAFGAMRERGAHESGGSMPGGGESGGLQHMAHNENNVVGKRQLASSSQTINANLEADAMSMVNMMLHALTRCITCRANTIVKPSLPVQELFALTLAPRPRARRVVEGACLQSLNRQHAEYKHDKTWLISYKGPGRPLSAPRLFTVGAIRGAQQCHVPKKNTALMCSPMPSLRPQRQHSGQPSGRDVDLPRRWGRGGGSRRRRRIGWGGWRQVWCRPASRECLESIEAAGLNA